MILTTGSPQHPASIPPLIISGYSSPIIVKPRLPPGRILLIRGVRAVGGSRNGSGGRTTTKYFLFELIKQPARLVEVGKLLLLFRSSLPSVVDVLFEGHILVIRFASRGWDECRRVLMADMVVVVSLAVFQRHDDGC